MHWQDIVLGVGNFVLVLALLPSILSSSKPAIATGIMSAAALLSFGVVYVSLHLWFGAAMVSLSGLLWIVLAIQKHRQVKSPTEMT